MKESRVLLPVSILRYHDDTSPFRSCGQRLFAYSLVHHLFSRVKHGVTQNGTELRDPDASTLALFVKHAPEVGQTMHCMCPFPAPLALHPLLQNYILHCAMGDISPICAPKKCLS